MLTYKCPFCNEKIILNEENLYDAVRVDKRVWHKQCLKKRCLKAFKSSNKRSVAKWKKIYDNREAIYEKSYQINKRVLFEDKITRFVLRNYPVQILSSSFYTRLRRIETGEFKGMSIGIPLDDLYFMWEKEMPYLRKVHERNKQKGKEFTGESLIAYDLAILRGDYDKYKTWKIEKEKTNKLKKEIEQSKDVSQSIEKMKNHKIANVSKQEDTKELNIEDALSSIFD